MRVSLATRVIPLKRWYLSDIEALGPTWRAACKFPEKRSTQFEEVPPKPDADACRKDGVQARGAVGDATAPGEYRSEGRRR